MEKNHLINKFQFGFRKNHNTVDHLYRLKEEIKFSLENKYSTIAIALDYTRAFDLVWRDGLLIKMMSLNIRGKIITWIKNFLTDRSNIIRIANYTSNPYILENGIPQGSSLSPTLFLIMINDFPSLSNYTSKSLFADDANIWRSGSNLKQISHHLQEDLLEIEDWSTKWGFIINKEKTIATIFSNKNSIERPTLKIKDHQIVTECKFKFLGFTFDKNLTWKYHIEDLIDKSSQILNIMKSFHGLAWGANNKTLLTIYKSLLRSRIDYGCFILEDACKTNLKKLDTLQYKALCIVLGAPRGTAMATLLAETGETSLLVRREQMLVKFLLKIKTNPSNITNETLNNKKYYNLNKVHKSADNIKINNIITELEKEITFKIINSQDIAKATPWSEPHPNIITELIMFEGKTFNKETKEEKFVDIINHQFPNFTHIYVDASQKEHNTIALFVPELAIYEIHNPSKLLDILSLEAFAILFALNLVDKLKLTKAVIFSDSRSVLTQLKHPNHLLLGNSSRPVLISEIREKIQASTWLCWIPGHSKITQHIITDNLTKSKCIEQTQENYYIELQEIMALLHEKSITSWQDTWSNLRGLTEYKRIHNSFNINKPQFVSIPNRKSEIIANRLRLSSNQLNYYLFKIGKAQTPLCDTCNVDETTEHFLTTCKKTKPLRDKLKDEIKPRNKEFNPLMILNNKSQLLETIKFIKYNKINI